MRTSISNECYCDGGGSVRHEASLRCTMWHKHLEPLYELQRLQYEEDRRKPRITIIEEREINDDF